MIHRPRHLYETVFEQVTAAAYFAATLLGQQITFRILCEKLMIISERFLHSAVPVLYAGR
jgi:hypothetical protein